MITNDNQLITHDIFISYRRSLDKYPATAIWTFLQSLGYDVWWDALLSHEDLTDSNGRFTSIIDNMVANCTDFILLISKETFAPSSMGGDKDWHIHELSLAMDNSVHILPILLDGAEIDTKSFAPEMPESIVKLLIRLKETNQFFDLPKDLLQCATEEVGEQISRLLHASHK